MRNAIPQLLQRWLLDRPGIIPYSPMRIIGNQSEFAVASVRTLPLGRWEEGGGRGIGSILRVRVSGPEVS
jgi:hypothetical protein